MPNSPILPKFEIGETVIITGTKFGITIARRHFFQHGYSGNWGYHGLTGDCGTWFYEDELDWHPLEKEKQKMAKETKAAVNYIGIIRIPGGLYFAQNTADGGMNFTTSQGAKEGIDRFMAKNTNLHASFRAYVIEESESVIVAARGNLRPQTPVWEEFGNLL